MANIDFPWLDKALEQRGCNHLGLKSRWLHFVQDYSGKKPKVIALKGEENVSLFLGNYFPLSSFGINKLVCGAFLDYGPSIGVFNRSELPDSIFFTREKTSLSVVTKETLNVNASYSQTLANIDLTKFEGNPTMDLISSRARNDIRRGLSNGISVNFGSKYISDFYLTYRKRMQELGTPHHGISFFQKLLQHFPRELSIGVAKQKSKLLAVSMDLHIGGIVYHLFAASTPEKRNSCAGDLLLWAKIADSINKGEREFWLGRSIVDSGVERYKAKWNPEFLPTSERITQIEKDLEIAHKQMNSETKKRVFAEIWKIIPSTQANLIGPPIRKLIP